MPGLDRDIPIEQLMDALWLAAENGLRVEDAQWRFSAEHYAAVKAAVRPGLDPFGDSDACVGLPYVVVGAETEPFSLEDDKWKITLSGLCFTPSG